jgi:hypothetical protein
MQDLGRRVAKWADTRFGPDRAPARAPVSEPVPAPRAHPATD